MNQLRRLLNRFHEQIAYLFFGGLATLLNIVLGIVFRAAGLPTALNTVLDNFLCILFAYCTNRRWVFCSKSSGRDALREFVSFVTCRLGTLVLDVAVMWLGVDLIGAAWIPAEWQNLWFLGVKVFSNVLMIVLNYVFSKRIIFRKKQQDDSGC